MTELEWLKQESGMSDDDLKAFEGIMGNAQFKTMLTKLQATKDTAVAAQQSAERDLLKQQTDWETIYQPEMRKVTQEALAATGENASLKAKLEKAREYGIVPGEDTAVVPPRAPGSPDQSQFISKDEISRLRDDAGRGMALLNDVSAEHFKLYQSPLPNSSELIDEVARQRKLGHQADLRTVWESKYNVPAKRAEIAAADQKSHDEKVGAEAVRAHVEKNGDNPNTRSPRASRFSTYDPTSKADGAKPWQRPPGMKRANNEGWRSQSVQKLTEASNGR